MNSSQQTEIQKLKTENSSLANDFGSKTNPNFEISEKIENEIFASQNLLKEYEAVILALEKNLQAAHCENSEKTEKIETLELEFSEARGTAKLDQVMLKTSEHEKNDLQASLRSIQKIWEDKQQEFEQNEIYCQEAITDFEQQIFELEGQKKSIGLDRKAGLQKIETLQGEIQNLNMALGDARGRVQELTDNVAMLDRSASEWVTFRYLKKIERRPEFREIEIQTRKFGPASEIREG